MAQASPVKESISESQSSSSACKLIFVDWPQETGPFLKVGLFDQTDFSQYDIIFFDPYQFALAHDLRSGSKEPGEVEYIGLDEREFLAYLKQVKAASDSLKKFLLRDGMLVIRSHIPKSHIKIRKTTAASVRKYTESIISAFFWLDEITGRCSFQNCASKLVRYSQNGHPLEETFGDCMIEAFQSQASISKGHVTIIGVGGSSGKSPLITDVSYGTGRGHIYFIPRFLVKDETLKLKQAFEKISATGSHSFKRPSWLNYYEDQIKDYNPFRSEIERIDLEIEALMKQRSALTRQINEASVLPHLLYESGPKLQNAIKTALQTLGFGRVESSGGGSHTQLLARVDQKSEERLVIRIAGPCVEAVLASGIERLVEALGEYTAQVRVKGVLIGSGMSSYPPDKRDGWIDNKSIETARRHEICLLSVYDLYTTAALILSRCQTKNIELIKTALRKDIDECAGLFTMNRPKYGI